MSSANGDAGPDASGEEAAWRDLIARFELPADETAAAPPWPSREDLPDSPAEFRQAPELPAGLGGGVIPDESARTADPAASPSLTDDSGTADPASQARVVRHARPVPPTAGTGEDGDAAADEDDEDGRYIPPPPAPLPRLDAVAKGAWTGLLGGPAYLLTAMIVGWPIAGWEALAAIIAFVGGFTVLVVRMGDRPSRGDDDDRGAVI